MLTGRSRKCTPNSFMVTRFFIWLQVKVACCISIWFCWVLITIFLIVWFNRPNQVWFGCPYHVSWAGPEIPWNSGCRRPNLILFPCLYIVGGGCLFIGPSGSCRRRSAQSPHSRAGSACFLSVWFCKVEASILLM